MGSGRLTTWKCVASLIMDVCKLVAKFTLVNSKLWLELIYVVTQTPSTILDSSFSPRLHQLQGRGAVN